MCPRHLLSMKTAFAVFGLSVGIAACGGSTSTNAPGDGGSSGSSSGSLGGSSGSGGSGAGAVSGTSSGAGAQDAATAGGGTMCQCGATEQCCVGAMGPRRTFSCAAANSCPTGSLAVACTGAQSCGGQV